MIKDPSNLSAKFDALCSILFDKIG